jgi:hypothetical protein
MGAAMVVEGATDTAVFEVYMGVFAYPLEKG